MKKFIEICFILLIMGLASSLQAAPVLSIWPSSSSISPGASIDVDIIISGLSSEEDL